MRVKVGLVDVDGHNFPNLAQMKLSAHYKARDCLVEVASPQGEYDVVYMSKVFDNTYQRWCNAPSLRKSCTFAEYLKTKRYTGEEKQ